VDDSFLVLFARNAEGLVQVTSMHLSIIRVGKITRKETAQSLQQKFDIQQSQQTYNVADHLQEAVTYIPEHGLWGENL
jgi:hypothetical protein